MIDCFRNNNIKLEIVSFLDNEEILTLSACNKEFKELLFKNNPIIIIRIFMKLIIDNYFEIEQSNYKYENKKNLLGKNINFYHTCKLLLNLIEASLSKCKSITTAQIIPYLLKNHNYLSDITKKCFNYGFENERIKKLFYDINSKSIKALNYDWKYIAFDNTRIKKGKEEQIKVSFEHSLFENFLFNLISLFLNYYINVQSSDSENCIDYQNKNSEDELKKTENEKMKEYYIQNLAKKDEENEELKKQLNEKNDIIKKLKEKIEELNEEIVLQKEKIEEKNKKIEKYDFIINIYQQQHFHEIKNFFRNEGKESAVNAIEKIENFNNNINNVESLNQVKEESMNEESN